MRNKVEACIRETTDSQIKFEENRRKVIFQNPQRRTYMQKTDDIHPLKTVISVHF